MLLGHWYQNIGEVAEVEAGASAGSNKGEKGEVRPSVDMPWQDVQCLQGWFLQPLKWSMEKDCWHLEQVLWSMLTMMMGLKDSVESAKTAAVRVAGSERVDGGEERDVTSGAR
ncbi:uncharacterized protein SPSC_05582 [Sporisorium scitamineum]|uniref:Uncharacterized protein n=1 Tax=Sporisorium scitamineum TaxID=49012 RepID=A0A127Z4H2_9BASI|nr:uncharacterized protein SPSC_05582 [Sporisorium scitamineum]